MCLDTLHVCRGTVRSFIVLGNFCIVLMFFPAGLCCPLERVWPDFWWDLHNHYFWFAFLHFQWLLEDLHKFSFLSNHTSGSVKKAANSSNFALFSPRECEPKASIICVFSLLNCFSLLVLRGRKVLNHHQPPHIHFGRIVLYNRSDICITLL